MVNDIQRDPDLWLEDGNIVIVASSTIAFRVYKGLLGRVSAVFEDTFKFKPDPEEKIDNCPVVHVPDSPVEMGHFLRAVFRSGLFLSRQRTLSFATIASIIRIAHKYQAQEIVDVVSDRLEDFLIPGPGHWIDSPALSWKERWELGQKQCGIAFDLQDAIESVNLAHLIDKPLMLPVALYLCCLLDPVQLRHGITRADLNVVEKLSDEDFARCVRALSVLAKECHATVLRSLAGWHTACSKCDNKLDAGFATYGRDAREGLTWALSDMLVRVDRRAAPGWNLRNLCSLCRESWWKCSAEECVKTRKNLPKYFALEDLDGWDSE
ncbi:hypothetical protein LXA43DRAFT_358910 [Ganoderma leucocontextum]|nr:hypothetical protein LXA43DRAFT_358910 [Ganoderma leucocontextum]